MRNGSGVANHYVVVENRLFIFEHISQVLRQRASATVERIDGNHFSLHKPKNNSTTLLSMDCLSYERDIKKNFSLPMKSPALAFNVIAYSSSFVPLTVMECEAMGISCLFDFRDPEDELLEVINALKRGGTMKSTSVQNVVKGRNWFFNMALTTRELEVARLFSLGYSAKEVASSLNLSFFTCKNHLRKLYKKIGISRVSQLIQQFRA